MLLPDIYAYISSLETHEITKERQEVLEVLAKFIQAKTEEGELINLNFICTHNSRRSHLCQIWVQAIAAYFHQNNIYSYSGGTTATSLYPSVIQTLKKVGFQFQILATGENTIYSIRYSNVLPSIIGFSKSYDNSFNPKKFAAIMTCDHANENCPVVLGATMRIPITYKDPKAFDNTPLALKKYEERSRQIATEMKWVFESISKNSSQ